MITLRVYSVAYTVWQKTFDVKRNAYIILEIFKNEVKYVVLKVPKNFDEGDYLLTTHII
jgi:hypothetical protein